MTPQQKYLMEFREALEKARDLYARVMAANARRREQLAERKGGAY